MLSALLCKTFFAWCLTINSLNAEIDDNARPYEFSFDIVDFQHRHERKDADGIISGEYGFITADGVYHETAYATDKDGSFIVKNMKNHKIKALKDTEELFKDKMLSDALTEACSGCKLPEETEEKKEDATEKPANKENTTTLEKKIAKVTKEMLRTLLKTSTNGSDSIGDERDGPMKSSDDEDVIYSMVEAGKKALDEGPDLNNFLSYEALEKIANDLFYSFNYTISTHGHREDGYRNGRKDGSYSSKGQDGKDAQVKYISNEFGHQPIVTLVPKGDPNDTLKEETPLKGYIFKWYRN